ncbi:hypothetical protein KAFR_0J02180 [Kazachstania africana CBS 2517]|uniref:Phosphoribulokinase/uridine kinase domain-containing protein n=1 Tax=Kazachstania africana (strain ATCC 22294 / BCRC 22015 / CBS 2517 / CECT 1963 / NBRC 1671 / NRRL Y-8276) TaxID=1071382 RepID=H2B0Y2_KAZAF|nr:hypothetical protein KAFR_0J02180 [Kazachstania africana CBS 2517]CCF60282.1 hypothetical protein KAFR_0J02180 [Kazachstania africana CBS 2517]
MPDQKVILVALGGCSSSGKTTIAKLTATLIPDCVLIHQDDFYKHDEAIPMNDKYGIQDWDCAGALDFDAFEKELDSIKRTGSVSLKLIHNNNVDDPSKFQIEADFLGSLKEKYRKMVSKNYKIVIVDGFMLFNHASVRSKFDLKLLIRASYDVLKRRRASRKGYQTLDSFWTDPPYYFDEFVYHGYKEAHQQFFINNDVEAALNPATADGILAFNNDDTTPIQTSLEWVCNELVSRVSDL